MEEDKEEQFITLSNLLVHVGTTLTVRDQFTIAHHTGGFQGVFAQRGTVTADNGDVFTIAYTGDDIVLTLVSRSRSRTEHMDRRCACDCWTRFHAASQTAEVE